MAELYTSAAASALEDGCRMLALSNEAAPELLKYIICEAKHRELGLQQKMFPSSKLEQLWQWMGQNPQVSSVHHVSNCSILPLWHGQQQQLFRG